MIAGPNGSGKSTLKGFLEARGAYFGEWLNADELARQLPGTQAERERAAQLQIRAARETAMAAGRDYCFETVMSHPSHVEHLLAARARGFEAQVIYVCTDDPRININRVGNRVAEGGHDVPVDKIIKRHAGSLANLLAAVQASDRAWLFDNSDWQGRRGFRLIARWANRTLSVTVPTGERPRWFARSLAPLLSA